MLLQGPSKNTNYMEWDKLWSMNRDIVDKTAKRFMAVSTENCVEAIIENFGDEEVVCVESEFHQKVNPY